MNPQDQAAQNAQTQNQSQPPIQPPAVDVSNIPAADQLPKKEKKQLAVRFEDDLVIYLDSDVVDDMRFFELYSKAEKDPTMIADMFKFLFGEEQWQGLFDYYESKGQKFTISKFVTVFKDFEDQLNNNPDFLSL